MAELKEEGKDVPTDKEALLLYKDACGARFATKIRNDKARGDLLFWFSGVVAGVSPKTAWDPGGRSVAKRSFFQHVHLTDIAFAIMVLREHRSRWGDPDTVDDEDDVSTAAGDSERKRKRVSTSEQSPGKKFYAGMCMDIKAINDECTVDNKKDVEKWLIDQHKMRDGAVAAKKAPETTKPDVPVWDENVFTELLMNNHHMRAQLEL